MQDQNISGNYQLIPTIRQVLQELTQSHLQLGETLNQLQIPPLGFQKDLRFQKVRLRDVIRKIPNNQSLELRWTYTNRTWVSDVMKEYNGQYELIKTACQNSDDLKKQQKKIYYLAVQLDLPAISPEFKQADEKILSELKSYQVALDKRLTVQKIEKNSISQQYFQDLEAQYMNPPDSQRFLHKYDHLINVCYYDSCNGQKQYQFVCYGEQTLQQLINKFDCMIMQLEPYYKYSDSSQPLLTIEDVLKQKKRKQIKQLPEGQIIFEFDDQIPYSLIDPYNNSQREKQQKFNNGVQYLLIDDSIYYLGMKEDLEKMIANNPIMKKRKWKNYSMSDVKIDDLRVVFGHPYVYRHLRGCDHIVIFKEARLFMDNNLQMPDKTQYPFKIFESRMKRKKCEACNEMFAEIVSISDPLKLGQNMYICKYCHEHLHLDQNGVCKFPNLKLIPYIHD